MPAELQTFINNSYLLANNDHTAFHFRRFGGNPLKLLNFDEDNYRKNIYTEGRTQPAPADKSMKARIFINIAASCFDEGGTTISYGFNEAGEHLGVHMTIDFTKYGFKLGNSISEVLLPVEELTFGVPKGKTRFRTYEDEMDAIELLTDKTYVLFGRKTYQDESKKKAKEILTFLSERKVNHTIKESDDICDDLSKLFKTVNQQPSQKHFYILWLTKKQKYCLCYITSQRAGELLKHGFLSGRHNTIPDEVFMDTY